MAFTENLDQNLAVRIGVNGVDEFSNQLKNSYAKTKDGLKDITGSINEEMEKAFSGIQDKSQSLFDSVNGNVQSTGDYMSQTINGHADLVNTVGDSFKNYLNISDPRKMEKAGKQMYKDLRKLRGEAVRWSDVSGISADKVVEFRKEMIKATGDIDGTAKMYQSVFEVDPKKAKGWYKEFHKFAGDGADNFASSYDYVFKKFGKDSVKAGKELNQVFKYGGKAFSLDEKMKLLNSGMEDYKVLSESLGGFDKKDMQNYFRALSKETFLMQKSGFSPEEVEQNAKTMAKFQALLQSQNKKNLLYAEDGGEAFAGMMKDYSGLNLVMGQLGVTSREGFLKQLDTKGITGIVSEMQSKFKDSKGNLNVEGYQKWVRDFTPAIKKMLGDTVNQDLMDSVTNTLGMPLKNVQKNVKYYNEENAKAMKNAESLGKQVETRNKKYFKGAIRTAEDYAEWVEKQNENDILALTYKESSSYITEQAKRLRSYTKSALKLAKDGDTYFAGAMIKRFSALKRMGIMGLFIPVNGKGKLSSANAHLMEIADTMGDLLKKSAPMITAAGSLGFRFQHLGMAVSPVTAPFKTLNNASFGLLGTFGKLTGAIGLVSYGLGKLGDKKVQSLLNGDGAGSLVQDMKDKASYDIARVFFKKKMFDSLKSVNDKSYKDIKSGKYSDMIVTQKTVNDAFNGKSKASFRARNKIMAVYGIDLPNNATAKDMERIKKQILMQSGERSKNMVSNEVKKRTDALIKITEMGLGIAGRAFDTVWTKLVFQIQGGKNAKGELVLPLLTRVKNGLSGFMGRLTSGEVFNSSGGGIKELDDRMKGALGIALTGGLMSKSVRTSVLKGLIGTIGGAMNLAITPLKAMSGAMWGALKSSRLLMFSAGITLAGAGYNFIQNMQDPNKRKNLLYSVETKLGLSSGTLTSIDSMSKFGNFFETRVVPSVSNFFNKAGDVFIEGSKAFLNFFVNTIAPQIGPAIASGAKLAIKGIGSLLTTPDFWKASGIVLSVVAGFKLMSMAASKAISLTLGRKQIIVNSNGVSKNIRQGGLLGQGGLVRDNKFVNPIMGRGSYDRKTKAYGREGGLLGKGGFVSKGVNKAKSGFSALGSKVRGGFINNESGQFSTGGMVKMAGMSVFGYQAYSAFKEYSASGDFKQALVGGLHSSGMALMMVNPLLGLATLGIGAITDSLINAEPKFMDNSKFVKEFSTNKVLIDKVVNWNTDILLMSIADTDIKKALFKRTKEEIIKTANSKNLDREGVKTVIKKSVLTKDNINNMSISELMNTQEKLTNSVLGGRADDIFKKQTSKLSYQIYSALDLSSDWEKDDKKALMKQKEKNNIKRKELWKSSIQEMLLNAENETKRFEIINQLSRDAKKHNFSMQDVMGNTVLSFKTLGESGNILTKYTNLLNESGVSSKQNTAMIYKENALNYLKEINKVSEGQFNVNSKQVNQLIGDTLMNKGGINIFANQLRNLDSIINETVKKTGIDKKQVEMMYRKNIGSTIGYTFENQKDLTGYISKLNGNEYLKIKERYNKNKNVAYTGEFDRQELNKASVIRNAKSKLNPIDYSKNVTLKNEFGLDVNMSRKSLKNTVISEAFRGKDDLINTLKSVNFNQDDFNKILLERVKKTGGNELVPIKQNLELYKSLGQQLLQEGLQSDKTISNSIRSYQRLKEAGTTTFKDIYDYEKELILLSSSKTQDIFNVSKAVAGNDVLFNESITNQSMRLKGFVNDSIAEHNRLLNSTSATDVSMAISAVETQKRILAESLGGVEQADAYFKKKNLDFSTFSMEQLDTFTSSMTDKQTSHYIETLKSYATHSSNFGGILSKDLGSLSDTLKTKAIGMLDQWSNTFALAGKLSSYLKDGNLKDAEKTRNEIKQMKDSQNLQKLYITLAAKRINRKYGIDKDTASQRVKSLIENRKMIITKDMVTGKRSKFNESYKKLFSGKNALKFNKTMSKINSNRSWAESRYDKFTRKTGFTDETLASGKTFNYAFEDYVKKAKGSEKRRLLKAKRNIASANLLDKNSLELKRSEIEMKYGKNTKVTNELLSVIKDVVALQQKEYKVKNKDKNMSKDSSMSDKAPITATQRNEKIYTDKQISEMASNKENLKILGDRFTDMYNATNGLLQIFTQGKARVTVTNPKDLPHFK